MPALPDNAKQLTKKEVLDLFEAVEEVSGRHSFFAT